MGFGTVDKIYVEFTKPFWEKDWDGVSFLWKTEQLKLIHEDAVNSEWMKDTVGFYTVAHQPNILCGWLSGKAARAMERVSENNFKTGVEHILKMFLTDWKGVEVKNIIRYVKQKELFQFSINFMEFKIDFFICSTKWSTNPHTLGSYSFYTLKADAVNASTSILAEPILDSNSKPLIQFAGEATNDDYYSTVHGAVESGFREAQRIIDLYNQ